MNITNFTDKELAAYEEYKNFRDGRWSKKRAAEEILGAAVLIAFAVLFIVL